MHRCPPAAPYSRSLADRGGRWAPTSFDASSSRSRSCSGSPIIAFVALSLAPGDPLTARMDPDILARMTRGGPRSRAARAGPRSAAAGPVPALAGRHSPRRLRVLGRQPQPASSTSSARRLPPTLLLMTVALHRRRDARRRLRDHRRGPPVRPARLRADGVLDLVHRDSRVRRRTRDDLSIRGGSEDPADDRHVHPGQAAAISADLVAPPDHAGRRCWASRLAAQLTRYTPGQHARGAGQRIRHDRAARRACARAGCSLRHAFRNALIPIVTVIGLTLPDLVAGAVITETLFGWPGMGQLAVKAAVQSRPGPDDGRHPRRRDGRADQQSRRRRPLRRRRSAGAAWRRAEAAIGAAQVVAVSTTPWSRWRSGASSGIGWRSSGSRSSSMIVAMAIFAPFITAYSPDDLDLRVDPPAAERRPSRSAPTRSGSTSGVGSCTARGRRSSSDSGPWPSRSSIGTVLGVLGRLLRRLGRPGHRPPDRHDHEHARRCCSWPCSCRSSGPSLESVVIVIALLTWPRHRPPRSRPVPGAARGGVRDRGAGRRRAGSRRSCSATCCRTSSGR